MISHHKEAITGYKLVNTYRVVIGLSQLCFENCLLCFWAVLKNPAYYAQNYALKIKIMLESWLFY